jgi:hypothetical protein
MTRTKSYQTRTKAVKIDPFEVPTRTNPHKQRAKSHFQTKNPVAMGCCNVNIPKKIDQIESRTAFSQKERA